MKALVLRAYRQLVWEDAPDPKPGPSDALIRVKACGICGSDVHGLDGSTGRRVPPLIMGHEAAGVIADAGKDVTGWSVDERVTFDSTDYCGDCFFCRRGQINLCDRRTVLGVSCGEYRRPGAFAEYVAVPARALYRLPEAITFERAAMIEPLSVAAHGVGRLRIRRDDTALVVGTGMIGLLAIQVLRQEGCARLFAADIEPGRLAMALRFGASEAFRSDRADVPAEVRRRTEGRGADAAFEAVGLAATVQMALSALRKGGALAQVGNFAPTVELPLQEIVARELTLYGACASSGEYPACLERIAGGAIRLDPLISAVAPMSEGPSWFERLYRREPGLMKVILCP
jgi:L-iditol 2-dehydrogenase